MRKIFTVMAVCVIAISISGCSRSKPIVNIEDVAIPSLDSGSPVSLDVVEKAIIKACLKRGWTRASKIEGLNVVEAELVREKYRVTIKIPYSQNSYSIVYKDSVGLGYDESGNIHKNYNGWVEFLWDSIQEELGLMSRYSR